MRAPDDEIMEMTSRLDAMKPGDGAGLGQMFDDLTAMLNVYPDDPKLRFLFANTASRAKHYGVAKAVFSTLLATHGNKSSVLINYATVIDHLGDPAASLRYYKEALHDPTANKVLIHSNMATAHIKLGQYEESLKRANYALAIDPAFKEAAITKGFALFSLGELGEAWDYYEQGIGTCSRISVDYGLPIWKGESDARLIIHGEQGLGDEIMYASCLRDVKAAAVAVDCDARLATALQRAFPEMLVVGSRSAKPHQKPWVQKWEPTHSTSIASLPVRYRRQESEFPGTPYLFAKSDLHAMYEALFRSATGKGKIIGIAWSGGSPDTKEKEREIPLEAFRPIIDANPDAGFVSLQYRDDATAQIEESGLPIVHYNFATAKGVSYEHTLAAIAVCDRIIATDTTAVHAAGALDIPTTCLLSTPCMWVHSQWQGDRSAWYDSVLLRRKPKGMAWAEFINKEVKQNAHIYRC